MALHWGRFVESVQKKQGITWAEIARRIGYGPNSIPNIRKREDWDTDLIDRMCKALNYNLYTDKAKEMSSILDPSGSSEPMASYESENYKQKLIECDRENKVLTEKVKHLEEIIEDKKRIISLIDK